MYYLNELRKIEREVYDNMGKASQLTIDTIQDAVNELDRDLEHPVDINDVGAILYDIHVMLEVWNPELTFDIEILKKTDNILEGWRKALEEKHNQK